MFLTAGEISNEYISIESLMNNAKIFALALDKIVLSAVAGGLFSIAASRLA